MSYTKLFIHAIFVVKDRRHLINEDIEPKLYQQITRQIENSKSKVLAINGCADHVHVLISMNPNISFSDLVKQIKGATSYWINSHNLIKEKFSWQKGPRGFTVSQSIVTETITYIKNQKEHHKSVSFREEFKQFLKIHNLDK
jgi:REP element-mobilizing transposase RayT